MTFEYVIRWTVVAQTVLTPASLLFGIIGFIILGRSQPGIAVTVCVGFLAVSRGP